MPPTALTCQGIGYEPFLAGDALLVATCPAIVLQLIVSMTFDEADAYATLMQALIPLLDAVQASGRPGIFRGRALEDAKAPTGEPVPWRWQGSVTVVRPETLAIDTEAELSPVFAARPREPASPEAIAFERAHPWLNRAIVDADVRDEVVERLTDKGLERMMRETSRTVLTHLVETAEPAHKAAFAATMQKRDQRASIQVMLEIMRARLTEPRFPPLALAVLDIAPNRAILRRLLDALVAGFLQDTPQAKTPS